MNEREARSPGVTPARDGTRPSRAYQLVSLFVVVVGVVGSVVSALAWSANVHGQAMRQFHSSAREIADALTVSLERDAGLTSTAGILVESTAHLTNAEFATWFHRLATTAKYPGSFGLIYVERVGGTSLPAFQATVGSDPPFGLPAPAPFALTPPASSPPYCLTRAGVVQTREGLDPSTAAISSLMELAQPTLDYCGLPIGRLLLDAEASGRPAAANLATLVASMPDPRAHDVTPAFLGTLRAARLIATITPVYTRAKPATEVARAGELCGWMLGVFQATDIVTPVLKDHPGWSATLSYTNPSQGMATLDGHAPAAGDVHQTFALAGPGAWTVSLAEPSATLDGSARTQGLVVLLGGLLVTFLLFLLIHIPDRARVRALRLVAERTAQLRHQALHDQLTDLPNRELIFDRLEQMLARAKRGITDIAVLFVDLDQFKDVNDTLGHAAGDHLLRQVGERLRGNVRPSDTVGRLGGDEFVVLLEDAAHASDPEEVTRRLIEALSKPFVVGDGSRTVRMQSASIGIATGVRDSAEELVGDADMALYEAKARQVGQYVVYRPEMREALASRIALDSELKKAFAEHDFFLVYQPIFNLATEAIVGFEALLRWRHPMHGVIGPGEFIGSLEQSGMIIPVGRMVLHDACRQVAAWRAAGHTISVSVNASALQFDSPEFVETVNDALSAAGVPPPALTIEITETCIMRDSEQSAHRLEALRGIGVKVAIDDFGTGYCSLAYLQQFAVDALKIDQSFVAKLDESSYSQQLVHTIMQLATALHLETVAEGVETPSQLRSLIHEHCTAAQGYLLARPLEAAAATDLLSTGVQLERLSHPVVS